MTSEAGLCECGCGHFAPIAKRDRPYLGHVAGQPTRFRHGHGNTGRRLGLDRWEERDMGYVTPCWIWTGAFAANTGYGHLRIGLPRRQIGAHRAMYQALRGSIPAGMQLDHLCRVRACVNPLHLEPVTSRENVRRGASAKLTPAAVRAIRSSTEIAAVLAKRFGVEPSAISNVRGRRTWKDLA